MGEYHQVSDVFQVTSRGEGRCLPNAADAGRTHAAAPMFSPRLVRVGVVSVSLVWQLTSLVLVGALQYRILF